MQSLCIIFYKGKFYMPFCKYCNGVGKLKQSQDCPDCNGKGIISKKMADFHEYYENYKNLEQFLSEIPEYVPEEVQ